MVNPKESAVLLKSVGGWLESGQMTALVRDSIGFSKDRGDSVNVVNAAFAVEKVVVTDTPLWKQAEVIDAARSFAWPVAALLFAFLVMQGMVKPALNAVNSTPVLPAGSQLNAVVAEDQDRPEMLEVTPVKKAPEVTAEQLRLEDARALTRANPVAVANIVKTWVNGEVPA